MADTLMTLEEASKQLQLSKEQITEMVKKGLLRGFLDQKTYKFRPADIEAYKKRLSSSATPLAEGGSKGEATEAPSSVAKKRDETTKIDLTEIAAEPEGEDKDQTSVLVPIDERGPKEKVEEAPVFQFSEKDLGLRKEQPSAAEEGDQTSLLMSTEEKPGEAKKESKPSFDFAGKNLTLPPDEEPGESVLVADESESSVDILEVTEESSSESASSASGVMVSEESSSESVKAPAADESKTAVHPAGAAMDKTVTNILGPPTEESDEALETLEVDEVVETREAVSEEAPAKPAAKATPEPAPVAEEFETVGLPAAEETKAAVADTAETAAVSGAVAEALKEAAGEEEKEEEEEQEPEPAAMPGAWETVTPCKWANGLMIAATVLLVLGGVMVFCEMFGIHNGFTAKLVEILNSQSP